jgi:hypothetical protein
MLLRLGWIQDQSIPFFWLSLSINFSLAPPFHLLPVNVRQVFLKGLRVEDEIIAGGVSLGLDDGVYEGLLLLLGHFVCGDVLIHRVILDGVLSHLRSSFLQLQVLLKPLELPLVGLVLLEVHVLGEDDVLCDFCSDFVQISVVEEPVFGKEDLLGKVGGFDVGGGFVERRWDVGIDGLIGGEIHSVVYFLLLYAVVLSVVFFSDLLEFYNSNVCSPLYLRKKAIVVTGSAF